MLIALGMLILFIDSFENNIDFTLFIESIKMFNNHIANNIAKQAEPSTKVQNSSLATILNDSSQSKKRSRDIQQEARGGGASGG